MTLYMLLIILPMLLGFWAQYKVKGTYSKYSGIASRSGIRGHEAAAYILKSAGISNVSIHAHDGFLSDHYDPTKRKLVLSKKNYHGSSLAALGVAAHEAGHAIQHHVGYKALQLRMSLIPITQAASQMLPFVIFGGFFFHIFGFVYLGIVVYLILTVFQLITLPVEFDASRRATAELASLGIIDDSEKQGVNATLNAAAWTYVAAFIASLSNLIYMIMVARQRS